MRVSGGERADGAARAGRRGAAGARGKAATFEDALRRAGGRAARGRPASDAAGAARGVAVRRAGADAKEASLSRRREAFREDERDAAPRIAGVSPATVPAAAALAPPAPVPELRALVRALPAAVDAAGLRAGAPLALSFGRSLDVELRATPGGVEVVLRAAAALARACEAELPRVVRALEARGVAVAAARVRSRAPDDAVSP